MKTTNEKVCIVVFHLYRDGWCVGKFYTRRDAIKALNVLKGIAQYDGRGISQLHAEYRVERDRGYSDENEIETLKLNYGVAEIQIIETTIDGKWAAEREIK